MAEEIKTAGGAKVRKDRLEAMLRRDWFTHGLIFDDVLVVSNPGTDCLVVNTGEGLIVIDAILPRAEKPENPLTRERTVTIIRERTVTTLPEGGSIMAKDTKERILAAALDLFSQNGYAGTNIRELTASLGLVKSSLYKHFASKEEIWDSLLDEMIAYYDARFGSPEHLPPVPDSLEGLVAMTMQMAGFTIRDEKVVKTRKLLTIEQFRDARARDLATKHFLTGLQAMFTPVFAGMMDRGLLRRDDPAMLAFAYTAPISALIHLCDREPEGTDEALARIEAFSRHFVKVHGAPDAV